MNAPYTAPPAPVWNPATSAWEFPQAAPPVHQAPPPAPVFNPATNAWEFPQAAPPAYAPPPTAAQAGAQPGYGAQPPAPPPYSPPPQQNAPAPAYAPPAGHPGQPGAQANRYPGRVKTGEVRLSYFYVLARDDDGKQRVTILIPKTDHAAYQQLMAAEQEALAKKWPQRRPEYFRSCIKDGDTYKSTTGKPAGPECKGHWFINCVANNTYPATVLDIYGGEITDPRHVQSGDYGRVSITIYGSDKENNVGTNCALNSVVFTRKGEPLGGTPGMAAEDEFAGDFQAPPPGYVPPARYTPPQAPPEAAGPQGGAPANVPQPQQVGGFNAQPAAPGSAPAGAPPAPVWNPATSAWEFPQPAAHPAQQRAANPTSAPPAPRMNPATGQWVTPHWDGMLWVYAGLEDNIPF